MNKTKIVFAAAAAACVASPAFAAVWQPYGDHSAEAPRAIYAQENRGVATLLSCNADGELSAVISLKEGDFERKMKANAPYRRTIDVSMTRNGASESQSPWTLIPAVDTLHSKTHTEAAKIYNATILGETVQLDVPREGSVTLDLPDVDDTFRAFAQTCAPGSN